MLTCFVRSRCSSLLERENEKLHAKVTALTHELARLRGADAAAAERQLAFLKELSRAAGAGPVRSVVGATPAPAGP
jgi:hypothetical protein